MRRKSFVKLTFLCLIVLFLKSCMTDDFIQQEKKEKATITSRIIRLNELKENLKLTTELQKLSKNSLNSNSTLSKIYTDNQNSFSVDLDDVMYTEDTYGQKTYTFKIIRDVPKENLENLVMVQKEEGFESFIFEYEKEIELNYFQSNEELKDAIREHVTITNLGRKTDINPNGRLLVSDCQDIVTTWVETPGTSCLSGYHNFQDGSDCVYWGTTNMALPAYGGHYEFTFTSGDCDEGMVGTTVGTTGPHGGGGGGNGGSLLTNNCTKVKTITQNITFKNNLINLEGKTGDPYESGWRMNYPMPNGTTNDFLQNVAGSEFVNLEAFPHTFALLHMHFAGQYPIFSPDDIILFNNWVNQVITNNQAPNPTNIPLPSVGDISLTVVSSNGTYMLTFDPNVMATQFQDYTTNQIEDLNKKYKEDYLDSANSYGSFDMEILEKEFLKFVRDKMNFPGMKLFKIESTGNTEIYLDGNNRRTKKCSQ